MDQSGIHQETSPFLRRKQWYAFHGGKFDSRMQSSCQWRSIQCSESRRSWHLPSWRPADLPWQCLSSKHRSDEGARSRPPLRNRREQLQISISTFSSANKLSTTTRFSPKSWTTAKIFWTFEHRSSCLDRLKSSRFWRRPNNPATDKNRDLFYKRA